MPALKLLPDEILKELDHPTQVTSLIMDCPNCGHTQSRLHFQDAATVWPSTDPGEAKPRAVISSWACALCYKTSVFIHEQEVDSSETSAGSTYYHWRVTSGYIVWPGSNPRELNEAAPARARSLFSEASLAEEAGALRGAAALYRATVEAILDDVGVAAGKLQPRIDALAEKGVAQDIVDDLHEARLLGNWSLHEGLMFEPDEVDDVARRISDAVLELYVLPEVRKTMQERRSQRREAASKATNTEEDQAPGSGPK